MKHIRNIGIVGYGQFGQFVHNLLTQYAPHISVEHRDKDDSHEQFIRTCQSDIIFLSVPIRVFEESIEQVLTTCRKDSMIFEVCTVKVYPGKVIEKYVSSHPYISTHPMFGPYSYQKIGSLKDLRLVICDHNLDRQQYANIKKLFQLLQLKVIEMSAEEHDKLLAKSLFLTHYITQTVIEAGLIRTDIDTVSFGNLMDVIESVTHDKALFQDVRNHNPYCKEMLTTFHNAQQKIDQDLGFTLT